jgi:hypothetical protein
MIPVDSLSKVATPISKPSKYDSLLKAHSPKKAAMRSAIIPGWGQVYNKKYWKVPIVYGALGATAAVFLYNINTYKDLRNAYKVRVQYSNPDATATDTLLYNQLSPVYKAYDLNAIRTYRDEFRQNIDYSVLIFIVLWGLNVADAAVDAHLKTFDVSPDLSLQFKFGHSQMAGTNGVSLVLALK